MASVKGSSCEGTADIIGVIRMVSTQSDCVSTVTLPSRS